MSDDKEVKEVLEITGSRQLGSNEVLCLPCLGRPFRLGMLYDFCQDTIIPGLTFWNPEKLAKTTGGKKDADPDQKLCLERPFKLGMVYDLSQDTIIPGLTSWNPEKLAKTTGEKKDADPDQKPTEEKKDANPDHKATGGKKDVDPDHKPTEEKKDANPDHKATGEKDAYPDQTSYSFEVLTEDQLSDKMFHFDAGPNLELSVLGGLVSVSGAAEFVKDRKQTKNTARVTLRYKCTSRFESLSMEHLAKLDHENIFDYTNATHVVTGLLYGAEMYFVFERRVESSENFFKIHADMEALIKKFPKVAIGFESKGEIEVKEDDREFLNKLQCKVYGDILLENNPTTMKESTKIYKNIPQVLKEKNMRNTIPKKVWLYPLCNLAKQHGKEKPAPILREIHSSFVEQSERFLEDIHDIILRTNEIQDKIICKSCKTFNSQLVRFKTMVLHYQLRFQKQIAEFTLKVRAEKSDENFPHILDQAFSSEFLFSPVLLDQWLDMREKEMIIIEETIKFFKNDWKETEELEDSDDSDNLKFALQQGKLEKIVHSFKFERVVSFEFIINQENAFLSAMEEYLQKEKVPESIASVTMSWCLNTSSLRKSAKLFKQLMVETRKGKYLRALSGRKSAETSIDKEIETFLDNTWKWEQSTTFVFAIRSTKDAQEAEGAVVAKYIDALRSVITFP